MSNVMGPVPGVRVRASDQGRAVTGFRVKAAMTERQR